MEKVKYPNITVTLSNHDVNRHVVIDKVLKAMAIAKVPKYAMDRYSRLAISGGYSRMMIITREWVNVKYEEGK